MLSASSVLVPLPRSFDLEWWYWLGLSGMFIGCAFRLAETLVVGLPVILSHYYSSLSPSLLLPLPSSSVKWVGLFVIVLVGMTIIKDLWDLLGNLKLTMVRNYYITPVCHVSIM